MSASPASLMTNASDSVPALTTGNTAPSSPEAPSRGPSPSPSLSLSPPPPVSASKAAGAKRKAAGGGAAAPKKRAKPKAGPAAAAKNALPSPPTTAAESNAEPAGGKPHQPAAAAHERGTYCHQCRRKFDPDEVLRCTRMRKYTKATPPRACNLAYCWRDLRDRYGLDPDGIVARGRNVSATEALGHDANKDYVFGCPCCDEMCQNATCRKKRGLGPLGDIVKLAHQAGVSPMDLVKEANASGPQPVRNARASNVVDPLGGSDLSDDEDGPTRKKPRTSTAKRESNGAEKKTAPKKTAAGTMATPKTKATAKKGAKASEAKEKVTAAAAKGKGKAAKETATKAKGKADPKAKIKADTKGKAATDTEAPKPRAKPKPKPKPREHPDNEYVNDVHIGPPVLPPWFEMLDTRLGQEEAEHRMYVREFIHRFRGLLRVSERTLPPLDDFDRPLTDVVVRNIAGALVGLHEQDLDADEDEELNELLLHHREDLRHYADLARFQDIFNDLEEPLQLRMPPPIQTRRQRNDRVLRELLDLEEGDEVPAWATDSGPSRRVAASRIPQPSDVMRMLVALIDSVLMLPSVRAEIEPGTLEMDARRKYTEDSKKEKLRWGNEKKKAVGTDKAKRQAVHREHIMYERMLLVNLRAAAAHKMPRFEPLGTDLDGRVYYCLTPRIIDQNTLTRKSTPVGWATGLLVWGPGIDPPRAEDEPPPAEDVLPALVSRWSHFGTEQDMRALHAWLTYRLAQRVAELSTAPPKKTARKKVVKEKPAKKGAAGTLSGTATPNGRPALPRKRSLVEVVLTPSRSRRVSLAYEANGDGADSDSDLSDAPEDILELARPANYVPSLETVKEQQNQLIERVCEVANWISVLEWKGIL